MLPVRMLQVFSRSMLGIRPARRFAWPWVVRLRTQYARAVPPIEVETRFDDGIRVRTSLSSHIESQLFWQGFQEADEDTVNAMKSMLPEDGVMIDCGANIGSFTLVAARHCPRGQVHAFEPSKAHLARLEHNLRLNGFKNVLLNPVGLSDESSGGTLYVPNAVGEMNNTGGATMFRGGLPPAGWDPEQIQLVRLDDYVEKAGIQRVDVIKIDIEGAELKALAGGRRMIERLRPKVLMEVDLENLERAGTSAQALLDFWAALNYQVVRLGDPEARPITSAAALRPHQNVICRAL